MGARTDGASERGTGLINEQHAFQSQLIQSVKPNLSFLHCEQAPYLNVFVRSALQN